MWWIILSACALSALGCLMDQPLSGGDLTPDFPSLPSGGPSDSWEEDLAEERRRRDDPGDPDWRGSFVIEATGAESIELDSTSLGEATYRWVERDLNGTPPHCMITLADRTPDAMQRQGYLIIRYVGDQRCAPSGEWPALINPGDEPLSDGSVTLSALRIDVEQEGRVISRSYDVAEGHVSFSVGDRGGLAGSISARFDRVTEEDDAISERPARLDLIGSFEAIE